MPTVTFRINGMTCQHCVQRVTAALAAVDGVHEPAVELEPGRATLDVRDEAAHRAARAAVAAAGYEVPDGP